MNLVEIIHLPLSSPTGRFPVNQCFKKVVYLWKFSHGYRNNFWVLLNKNLELSFNVCNEIVYHLRGGTMDSRGSYDRDDVPSSESFSSETAEGIKESRKPNLFPGVRLAN